MIIDKGEAVALLDGHHNRRVRAILASDSAQSAAIFCLVRQEAMNWTPRSWGNRIAILAKCEDKLGDWLATRL